MNESDFDVDDHLPSLVFSLPPIPQLIILGIIFLASLLLNFISIISIIGARAITPINLLIINLAVSDIVYSSTIPVFAVHIVLPWWPFGRLGCQLVIATDIIAMLVSCHSYCSSLSRKITKKNFSPVVRENKIKVRCRSWSERWKLTLLSNEIRTSKATSATRPKNSLKFPLNLDSTDLHIFIDDKFNRTTFENNFISSLVAL